MATNSEENKVKICQKQTTIERQMQPTISQQLCDTYGKPKELNKMYTKYTHPKRNITLIIDELPDVEKTNKYTLTTITPFSDEVVKDLYVLIQQANITSVTGDAHDFARSLGFTPSHTWVERGEIYTQESINIKVFNVCNCNGEEIDPENVVVSVEATSQLTQNQIDNTCKQVANIYRCIFPDRLSFPQKR